MSSAFCSCSIYSFFPLIVFISFSLSPLHLFFLSSALFLSPHPLYLFFPSSSLSLFPLTLFISFSPHPLYLPPPPFLILFISFFPHPLYLFFPSSYLSLFHSSSLSLFPLPLFISFSPHPLYLPPSLILLISFSPSFSFPLHPHYPLTLFISFSPFPSSTLSFFFFHPLFSSPELCSG